MLKKIVLYISVISFIQPVFGETRPLISDGMRGLTTNACVEMVKQVETKMMKNLPIRTHPVINQNDPKNNVFSATTIVDYKGNDSQVNISATPIKNSCNVVYMETFVRKEPCIISREKIMKKWNFVGKLNETMVFNFRRDDKFFGYLTPQGFNSSCLISKRRVFYDK
tara:strand:- start:49 stop:549 length:501 start_codon:yes stop_codon:yes gene_type:complete